MTMKKIFAILLALVLAMPVALATDLSSYPFDNVNIVVGDNADTTNVVSAIRLSNALKAEGFDAKIMLASEVADPTGMNIISIGDANDNPLTATLLTDDTYTLTDGNARIKLFDNTDHVHIVAYGNTPDDTTKAVHVLENWKDFPMQTDDTVVSGTIPDLTLYRLIPHVDYTCGGTQTYIFGDPLPQPCFGQLLVQYLPDPNPPAPVPTPDPDPTPDPNPDPTPDPTPDPNPDPTPDPTPGAAFSFNSITLGDSSQNRGETVTKQFTLTNTGTVDLTGFTFSGLNSKYELDITGFPSTLASSDSATLTVSAFVPYDHDAVNNKCDVKALEIGTLTINTVQGASASHDVEMQAVNELRITDVRADFRDEKDKRIEGKTTDMYWNDDVEIRVEVANRFTDDDDIEGQDQEIDVELEIDGDTKEIDIDDGDEAEVPADEKDELVANGVIENDAKGRIRLILTAEGRDEKGAKHCDQTVIKFNVIEGYWQPPVVTQPVIDLSTQDNSQQTTTTVQPEDEPREESVEVITPVAQVTESRFRDSKGYVALLITMIVLMLGVIAAELVFIHKRRKNLLAEQEFYGQGNYDQQE